jgi:hypothetical protein
MTPGIYHNNGRFRALLNRKRLKFNLGPVYFLLLEKQLHTGNALKQQLQKPEGLDVVLCTNRRSKQATERALEYLGMDDFVVLGRQLERWQHIQKLKLIVEYIRENPAPGVLLHLDAPDVLVTGDLRNAMECFSSAFDCDLLLGAEKNSMPSSQSAVDYTDREARFLTRIEQFGRLWHGDVMHMYGIASGKLRNIISRSGVK